MQPPQFLLDLLQLLLDLAVPAAFCTLAAAGVSLRHEGGVNFHVNGRTGKWVLWTIVLLTLPQLLSWIAAQGIRLGSTFARIPMISVNAPMGSTVSVPGFQKFSHSTQNSYISRSARSIVHCGWRASTNWIRSSVSAWPRALPYS